MAKKEVLDLARAQMYLNEYNRIRSRQFRAGKYIGGGALGSVFQIEKTEPPIVVKISRDKGEKGKEWVCFQEIDMMRLLGNHENIVRMLDAVTMQEKLGLNGRGGVHLLFMPEYQPFRNEKANLTEEEFRQMAIDICKALEHCAGRSVLHRDVKPENLFSSKMGQGRRRFLLGDFNIAKVFNTDKVKSMCGSGTPGFAAPEIMHPSDDEEADMAEQIELKAGCFNSDVYGLGMTLYYLLTEDFPDLVYRSGNARRKLKDISGEFERIIMKAVRFDPSERYGTAAQMREALERLTASHHTEVFHNNRFIWAKEALMGKKLTVAMQYAEQGLQNGEEKCRLLLCYCDCIRLFQAHGQDAPDQFWRAALPVASKLNSLAFQQKDMMALFLLGQLCYKAKKYSEFFRYTQTAAENGCVPAMFFWGKILFDKTPGYEGRIMEGAGYLVRAAEAEFEPALRVVKRELERNNRAMRAYREDFPKALRQRLECFKVAERANMLEAFIQFL